jgi:AAA+ ATPase superfamily predicted ATPase
LGVIKGRRRIGKSRLVAEFAAGARFINITVMPPETGTKAQDQRDIFTYQMEEFLNARVSRFQDWIAIFSHLTTKLTDKPTVILFEEIS